MRRPKILQIRSELEKLNPHYLSHKFQIGKFENPHTCTIYLQNSTMFGRRRANDNDEGSNVNMLQLVAQMREQNESMRT